MESLMAYAIRCKKTGRYKRQRDWCFRDLSTMTALYRSERRAITESKRFSDAEIVKVKLEVIE